MPPVNPNPKQDVKKLIARLQEAGFQVTQTFTDASDHYLFLKGAGRTLVSVGSQLIQHDKAMADHVNKIVCRLQITGILSDGVELETKIQRDRAGTTLRNVGRLLIKRGTEKSREVLDSTIQSATDLIFKIEDPEVVLTPEEVKANVAVIKQLIQQALCAARRSNRSEVAALQRRLEYSQEVCKVKEVIRLAELEQNPHERLKLLRTADDACMNLVSEAQVVLALGMITTLSQVETWIDKLEHPKNGEQISSRRKFHQKITSFLAGVVNKFARFEGRIDALKHRLGLIETLFTAENMLTPGSFIGAWHIVEVCMKGNPISWHAHTLNCQIYTLMEDYIASDVGEDHEKYLRCVSLLSWPPTGASPIPIESVPGKPKR